MQFWHSFLITALLVQIGIAPSDTRGGELTPSSATAPPHLHTIALNGHNFTLPAGFTIEQVTTTDLVPRPIVADFDEQGRLYVADSSGSNDPVETQLEKKPHRIVRLVDSDGDGKFDKQTVFADKLMFPAGILYYRGSVYVTAPPAIWKLTDTNDDGVADKREIWFDAKTLTGCANDLHGPYLGRDGWIYWCKGAFAEQTYDLPRGPNRQIQPWKTRAAHIFRARPDDGKNQAGGIEPVMNGGMDNPVDVVQLASGERIFSCTFLQHPGGGNRDGLIHAVYGGVWGKDHDVIYEHPWTGPEFMPVMTHLGPAAPSGLTEYEASTFGADYTGNLFAANFNLHKVTRHKLIPDGATYRTEDSDFVVSDQFDFHPTDVLADADGSLLIIDTGGWYKLCCPTSQLHKPDVLGAIYRVRKINAPRIDDPRGLKIDWEKSTPQKLVELLADSRPAVCVRAIEELSLTNLEVIPLLADTLKNSPPPPAGINAIWAACRREDGRKIPLLALCILDKSGQVHQAALHAISVWRDRDPATIARVSEFLTDPNPQVARAAAECLGRVGTAQNYPAILEALENTNDRIIRHSLTYALIEIGDEEALLKHLTDKATPAKSRLAVWVALDQLHSNKPNYGNLAVELATADPASVPTLWWLMRRHSAAADALAGQVREMLNSAQEFTPQQANLLAQAGWLVEQPAIQNIIGQKLGDANISESQQIKALQLVEQARLRDLPQDWVPLFAKLLTGSEKIRAAAIQALAATSLSAEQQSELKNPLLALANDAQVPIPVRLGAMSLFPPNEVSATPELLQTIWQAYDARAGQPFDFTPLARLKMTAAQLRDILPRIASCGPLEIEPLVSLYAQSRDDALAAKLLDELEKSPAAANLQPEVLAAALRNVSEELRARGADILRGKAQTTDEQRARLEELLARLPKGNIRRGQAVFVSSRAACQACHAIGYVGGNVGPDLSAIGKIRQRRDLLESILYPSSSLVRSYEPVAITTRDGRTHNGVIRGENDHELRLATGPNQELRLPRDQIEDRQESKISVMPAGLDQQLTEQELADLVEFLLSRN
ncbi:MAG: HEAT repeat domain-containing protein [Pirellulales bacterium]|nr:HEAT repeat domain-containing protein [Pirellulales bacterium]